MQHIYCVFCLTQRSRTIAKCYQQTHPQWTVIVPTIVQRKWIKGQKMEEIHDLFPGYLFLYTPEELQKADVFMMHGVLRILQGEEGLELTGADRSFAEMLLAQSGQVGIVPFYEEGQMLHIGKGILAGLDGRIIKVDRHRQRAMIEFEFDKTVRRIWVGYDVI